MSFSTGILLMKWDDDNDDNNYEQKSSAVDLFNNQENFH